MERKRNQKPDPFKRKRVGHPENQNRLLSVDVLEYVSYKRALSSRGKCAKGWPTRQDIETNTALPYANITDPQTLNKYGYVRNNPLRYVDPDGHAFGLDDLAGSLIGGTVGALVEVGKDLVTGQNITTGGVVAAAVGGAIFGEGLANAPETLGGSVVAAAAVKGAAEGFVLNGIQQGVDLATGAQKNFSGTSLAVSTATGAVTGGLASQVPLAKVPGFSSGKGNMIAAEQGVRTKISNGTASRISLKTLIKGAIGGQVATSGKTVTKVAGEVTAKKACNAVNSGACN